MNSTITIETMDPVMADVLTRKTEKERLAIAWGMWRSARAMLRRLITNEHPGWTTDQIDAEVVRRMSDGA